MNSQSREKKNTVFVILITLIACIAMILVDGVAKAEYWTKSFIKLIFFLVVPLIYAYGNKGILSEIKQKLSKDGFIRAVKIGASICIIIIGAFFLVNPLIDFSGTVDGLKSTTAKTVANYFTVATYILLINSFIEEFFFRGFIFLNLKKFTPKFFASCFSALIFAVYHVGMMVTWFNIWVLLLIIFFIALGGMIFNYLADKYTIWASWIVHMFANLAIGFIGIYLLYLK